MLDQIRSLTRLAGDAWMLALAGAFFVMICESAKPRPAEGEARREAGGLGVLVATLSLLTPILLFVHAFIAGGGSRQSLMLAVWAIGAVVIAAALIGWLIAAAAAPVGRVLSRAAPLLAVVIFGFTVWVTWRSALEVVNRFVLNHAA
jgi:hypothetical protein